MTYPQRQPQWVGNVRPYVPRPKAIPVWSNQAIIAERGNGKFSTFSVKLLGASQDFPTVSVNITLGSGTGVSFASLSPQEFTNFVTSLVQWHEQVMGLVPNLQRQAEQLQGVKKQFEEQLSRIKQAALQTNMLQAMMGGDQDEAQPNLPFPQ